jgi:hypothetical protein
MFLLFIAILFNKLLFSKAITRAYPDTSGVALFCQEKMQFLFKVFPFLSGLSIGFQNKIIKNYK